MRGIIAHAPQVYAPQPPAGYTIPGGAHSVTDAATLKTELAKGTAEDIVCEDGTYNDTAPFNNQNSHRIYSRNLYGATFNCGVDCGGNFGAGSTIIRGVNFDISSTSKSTAGNNAAIEGWGNSAATLQVYDCKFHGHDTIATAIWTSNPTSFQARRLYIQHFTANGLRVHNNTLVAYGSATPHINTITDIDIDYISHSTPGSGNGTEECGMFIGHPVDNGVSRIHIQRPAWAGIITVLNSWDTVYSDIDIDLSNSPLGYGVAGFYFEHYSYNLTVQRFRMHGCNSSIWAEWADPGWGGNPATGHGCVIQDGTCDGSPEAHGTKYPKGIYFDDGNPGANPVTRIAFNDLHVAFQEYNNSPLATKSNLVYSKVDTQYSTVHWNTDV